MKFILRLIVVFMMVGSPYAQSNLTACPSSGYFHNCFGTLTQGSDNKYVGEFKDNKFNGQGTYTFASGNKYVGEWKDNQRNGQGTFTFAEGSKYVGEFKDGMRNGQGIFYLSNGSISHSGVWSDDRLVTAQSVDPATFTRIAKGNSVPSAAEAQQSNLPAILGDKELRDFLSENWPQWGKREIEHAINSEAANIKKSNPNFTTAQINAAVKDLWYKRAGYKNNPETRPNAKNTLASRKGFNGQLELIDSQVELEGACVAIAQSFVNNARGSAFDTRGAAKWSICAAQSNITNTLFTSSVSKWRKTFQNDSPVTLGIYLDQCYSKILVQWDNSTGKCL